MPDQAVSYNVYRGLLSTLLAAGELRTSDMTQLACAIQTDADMDQLPDTTDDNVPVSRDGYTYLISGNNVNGEGPLGPVNADPLRVHDAQCP